MHKGHVVENLNRSLLALKDAENTTLSDKTLKTISASIEEAVSFLENDKDEIKTAAKTKTSSKGDAADTIDNLGLSPRSSNALKRAGLMTIRDINGIKLEKLKNIKGLGDSCVNEILKKAKEHGVTIKG